MPNRAGLNRRTVNARERIKANSLILSGGQVELALKIRKRDKQFSGMLYLEEMAGFTDWLLENQGQASPPETVINLNVPLEYLTMDGLRWLAEQRGVDVSELGRKSEIIKALEG